MKVNEITVGDWVHYSVSLGSDGMFDKGIQIKDIYGNYVNCSFNYDAIISGYRISLLRPIPLTEEILEANGWYEGDDKSWNHHDVVFNLKSYGTDYPFMISISGYKIGIYYVHELQHALRLCGLNELSDNFNIE